MRVVVAEDQMLTREGLIKVITNAGDDVVGEAADYDAVRRLVAQESPDIVILDIRLPPTQTLVGVRRRHAEIDDREIQPPRVQRVVE